MSEMQGERDAASNEREAKLWSEASGFIQYKKDRPGEEPHKPQSNSKKDRKKLAHKFCMPFDEA